MPESKRSWLVFSRAESSFPRLTRRLYQAKYSSINKNMGGKPQNLNNLNEGKGQNLRKSKKRTVNVNGSRCVCGDEPMFLVIDQWFVTFLRVSVAHFQTLTLLAAHLEGFEGKHRGGKTKRQEVPHASHIVTGFVSVVPRLRTIASHPEPPASLRSQEAFAYLNRWPPSVSASLMGHYASYLVAQKAAPSFSATSHSPAR